MVLGSVYLGGWIHGSSKVSQVEEQATQAQDKQRVLETGLQGERRSVLQLEARRRLHLVLLAMDQRNFGIAEKHLEAAGKLLTKPEAQLSGDLEKLAEVIAGAKLVAQEDLSDQRKKILGWVERFDKAAPPLDP